MRFKSGWLFDRAKAWRQEAVEYRERHGQNLRTLETVADELESALEEFLSRTVRREEIAEITGYSDRQVARWIKDGAVTLNQNGEARLLDLPIRPGHLPQILGLRLAPSAAERGPIQLNEEREKRSRPWIKRPDRSTTGS